MRRISINIIKILLIVVMLQTISSTTCQADQTGFWSNIIEKGETFLKDGEKAANDETKGGSPIDQDALKSEIGKFYNMFLMIGIAVAVIGGAILGIKFITGTIEEQAKIKEALIPYIIGCIVIFGAFGIWKFVIEVLSNI